MYNISLNAFHKCIKWIFFCHKLFHLRSSRLVLIFRLSLFLEYTLFRHRFKLEWKPTPFNLLRSFKQRFNNHLSNLLIKKFWSPLRNNNFVDLRWNCFSFIFHFIDYVQNLVNYYFWFLHLYVCLLNLNLRLNQTFSYIWSRIIWIAGLSFTLSFFFPNLLVLLLNFKLVLCKLDTCENSCLSQSKHSLLFFSLDENWWGFWFFFSLISVSSVIFVSASWTSAWRVSTSVFAFRFPRRVWIRTMTMMLSTFYITMIVFSVSISMPSWTSLARSFSLN